MNGDHSFSTWIGNLVGGGTLIATLVGWLPATITIVASLIAMSWYLIQIAESDTVQRYRASRRARKLARLRARLLLLEAKPPPSPAPDV